MHYVLPAWKIFHESLFERINDFKASRRYIIVNFPQRSWTWRKINYFSCIIYLFSSKRRTIIIHHIFLSSDSGNWNSFSPSSLTMVSKLHTCSNVTTHSRISKLNYIYHHERVSNIYYEIYFNFISTFYPSWSCLSSNNLRPHPKIQFTFP